MKTVIVEYSTSPGYEKFDIKYEGDWNLMSNILVLFLADGKVIGINTNRIRNFSIEEPNEQALDRD